MTGELSTNCSMSKATPPEYLDVDREGLDADGWCFLVDDGDAKTWILAEDHADALMALKGVLGPNDLPDPDTTLTIRALLLPELLVTPFRREPVLDGEMESMPMLWEVNRVANGPDRTPALIACTEF